MTSATFGDTFARFLDEYFERYPSTATAAGDHRFDATWPDPTEAGRLDRLAFIDRWREGFAGLGGLTADEEIDRDLLLGELDAARFAEGDSARTRGIRSTGSTSSGRACSACCRAISRRWPTASPPWRAGSRACRRSWTAPGRRSSGSMAARSRDSRRRRRSRTCPAWVSSSTRRSASRMRRPAIRPSSPSGAAWTRRRPSLARRWPHFEAHLRDVVLPASDGDGRVGADAIRSEDAPHDALRAR